MMPKASTHLLAASSLPSKSFPLQLKLKLISQSLLQSEGEETLQMAVTQVFREFGPVFVKIRRDAKQMPFAFCQYTVSLVDVFSLEHSLTILPRSLHMLIVLSRRVVVV
jgi:hypothetical protein